MFLISMLLGSVKWGLELAFYVLGILCFIKYLKK